MRIQKWVGFLILVVVFGGCVSRMPNLVEQGVISLEKVNPPKVLRISYVDIDRGGEGMRISGRVKRQGTYLPFFYSGHIDVTVIGLDGVVLAKVGTPYFPRRVPIKRGGYSNFKISIPIDPSPGTTVRVEYHGANKIDPKEHYVL